MAVLASTVMAESAALLNDVSQTYFTNTVLLPFLSKANDELGLKLAENNISIVRKESSRFDIAAGIVTITLPADFLLPLYLEEKSDGADDSEYVRMTQLSDDPRTQEQSYLNYWWFKNGVVSFVAALQARDLMLHYQKMLTAMSSASSVINFDSTKTFLASRTAELAAGFLGENPDRAAVLHNDAEIALDVIVNLLVKNQQSIGVRRRAYRSGVKRRF